MCIRDSINAEYMGEDYEEKERAEMNKASIFKTMILRPPKIKPTRIHPHARRTRNRMTQPPEPLAYKLHQQPEGKDFEIAPLSPKEPLPFRVERTHVGNLPVYREYRNARSVKRTVIRHIYGDIEAFTEELSKVVSNSKIDVKVGRVEVQGLHRESVSLWLQRLGF
eukprot:TRINITY_DN8344_c0_g1_i2.p1 TRINITY_DN8344_c0_g1~~TRINITY_DN8344_c0_g1_i2.p1  ORF type:complete len:185 (+),score=47.50 TRINITY_DN8344_c0_g1_i2:60-557(+)